MLPFVFAELSLILETSAVGIAADVIPPLDAAKVLLKVSVVIGILAVSIFADIVAILLLDIAKEVTAVTGI